MDITFLGATREVTGSCALIHCGKYKILVDCGLLQGSREFESHNADQFAFSPSDIDAVVLSHAHIDHSGRLPLLVKRGFRGPIYAQEATADLCEIMLVDSGFLAERQAEWENRKHRKNKEPIEPLYTQQDALDAHSQFEGLKYNEQVEILPGITINLHDAGHILGSAVVDVTLQEGDKTRRLVFSGDLGHTGDPILREPTALSHADLVIMESTYGDRLHRSWDDTWTEVGEILSQSVARKGNIIIPAFTVGRTQELLLMFKTHFKDWGLDHWEVFLDSPMAKEATRVYEKHWRLQNKKVRALGSSGPVFDLPNLHISESVDDSMGINRIKSGAIIIAGSGMCTGGRIRHHLRYNIGRKGNKIMIVGFQARGTTGRMLVDGASKIKLFGDEYTVNASVHTVGGLSAHADHQGLINWYNHFDKHPPIKLVHGEETAMDFLQTEMKQRFKADVSIAERGETLRL